MSASTNNQSKAFFNLVTTGSGWVNRIRSINLRKGSALALTFVALRGEADENGKTESTTIELYVRGSEAKAQIQSLIDNGWFIGELYSKEQIHYQTGGPKDINYLYDPISFLSVFKNDHL